MFGEALLQLAPSCGSLADSYRSGELSCASSVFVKYGPFICEKSAKSVYAIWTSHLRKGREVCSEALCVQAATRARAMKFIEVGRAKAGFSLWERRSASRYCEHVLRASELWSVPFWGGKWHILRHSGCECNSSCNVGR